VGVRGNRIKNITSELAGERIDIVRWSDDAMALIPAALQPAEVEQVLLCDMIGRAIVLVKDDQLSQAIGKFGQNVRLASKLVGWDIEIMTASELEEQIDRAVSAFLELDGMTDELAQRLVEQGYLSYDDLSVIEPDALMEMGGITAEQVDAIVDQAEERAEEAERIAEEQKKLKKEQELAEQLAASQAPAAASAATSSQDQAPPLVETESVDTESGAEASEETSPVATAETELAEDSSSAESLAPADASSDEPMAAAEIDSSERVSPESELSEPQSLDTEHTEEITRQPENEPSATDAPEETMDQTNVADRN
jgi:N utilization substance protein A